jgi:hypothetical protein
MYTVDPSLDGYETTLVDVGSRTTDGRSKGKPRSIAQEVDQETSTINCCAATGVFVFLG